MVKLNIAGSGMLRKVNALAAAEIFERPQSFPDRQGRVRLGDGVWGFVGLLVGASFGGCGRAISRGNFLGLAGFEPGSCLVAAGAGGVRCVCGMC